MLTSVSTEELDPADHPIPKIGVVVDAVGRHNRLSPTMSTQGDPLSVSILGDVWSRRGLS